jgi:hypothetical protein
MEVHGGLRPARGSAGEPEQGDIVAAGADSLVANRLVQRRAVEFGVVVGGAVEAQHLGQQAALLCTGHQLVHQPGVAQRQGHLRELDDRGQLGHPQHRHGVHHHGSGLGGRQPAGDHRRVVGGPDQHPVARSHPEVLGERVREAVRPVGELLVGAPSAVADQGGVVTEAALHHPVGELDRHVEVLGILEPVEVQLGPLVERRQVFPGEGVDVAAGAQAAVHGTTAVASISTLARSSTSPATSSIAIAG